ncbi:MAG: DUF5018 domain-containing protein [Bacteroidales bacterium]|nr:DUF5018 domain-containing protein [Bacteroidales bacterium]
MKFNRFFAFLAAASMIALAASCNKEPQPEPEPEPEPVVKSDACKLTALSLEAAGQSIEGFVYEEDKVVEVAYMPDQYAGLANATAKLTVSDKATVSPDPTVAADYTVEGGVKFTVTAEDGEHKAVYTVVLKEAEFNVKCQLVWQKTYGDLGVGTASFSQSNVGFSGTNFVTRNLEVLDLTGAKVGTLNVEGVAAAGEEGFGLACVTNDHAGHLVASVGVTADDKPAPNSDSVVKSYIYVWKNGWDKAPEQFYYTDEGNVTLYMSAGGDLTADGIINVISPGRGATTMFHTFYTTAGAEGYQWAAFNTQYVSNDGNWGQMVSPATGKISGDFVVCDSQGNNNGMMYYVRHGYEDLGADVALNGTVLDDALAEGGGSNQYGNYSIGHARAFTLNGTAYVVACSSGWPCTYVTIQTLNPEDENHYLLRTQVLATPAPVPCSAYCFDESTGKAYVLVSAQSESPMMALYEIITEIL